MIKKQILCVSLIFLMVLSTFVVLFLPVNTVKAVPLFSDGFEGDLSNWTDEVHNSFEPAASTDQHYSDSYSLKPYGEGGDISYVYKDLGGSYSTLYCNFYYFVNSTFGTWSSMGILGVFVGGTEYFRLSNYRESAGAQLQVINYHTSEYYYGAFAPTANTWYNIEIEVVRHATAGEVHVWVDGTPVLDETGLDTGDSNFNRVGIGYISAFSNPEP